MSEGVTSTRLSKAAREFNIGVKTVVDFLIEEAPKYPATGNKQHAHHCDAGID